VEHLGCNLVVVLGHTNCGAVASALQNFKGVKVQSIMDKIMKAAGDVREPIRVTELNVIQSVNVISEDLRMDEGVSVIGGIYDICNGTVRFL